MFVNESGSVLGKVSSAAKSMGKSAGPEMNQVKVDEHHFVGLCKKNTY